MRLSIADRMSMPQNVRITRVLSSSPNTGASMVCACLGTPVSTPAPKLRDRAFARGNVA